MAKGQNNIQLYGEELNTYPTWTYTLKGLGFLDSDWKDGTRGNSGIRKTGVVPNTAVSTIALNTALKQASVGAKIIGELLSADVVGLQQNVETDDLTMVPNYVSTLTAYLAKIQGLIDGTEKTHTAENYDTGAGGIKNKFDNTDNSINTVNSQLSTITNTTIPNTINALKTNIEDGTITANRATYYTDGGGTTIAAKFAELQQRLSNLGYTWGYANNPTNVTDINIHKLGKFVVCRFTYTSSNFSFNLPYGYSPYTDVSTNIPVYIYDGRTSKYDKGTVTVSTTGVVSCSVTGGREITGVVQLGWSIDSSKPV